MVMTREGNPGGGPRGARGALEDVVAVRGADRARAPGARRKTPMWPRVAREVSTWAVARLPEAPGGAPGVLGAQAGRKARAPGTRKRRPKVPWRRGWLQGDLRLSQLDRQVRRREDL